MRWKKSEYDKLYDQVKSGKRTVCYVDYDFFKSDKPPVRDICTIKPIQLELSARGICYGMLDSGKLEKEAFIEMCESVNVEWLDEQDEGWVPVAKELPDRLRPVLIYEPGPNVNDYTIAVSFWDGTYSKDKRKMPQFPDGQDEQPGYYWPSHWRPLPAPPATT